ncbi:MAG: ATP-binding protein, partial [Pseudomonadota bacterium]
QMLVSIRYRLEAMIADFGSGGDKVRGHAEQASETIVAAIAEVRRISHDMRPLVLDDMGLAAALQSLAEEFPLSIKVDVDDNAARFSADVETAIYRVAQEALSNVKRHADAEHITLGLQCEDDWVTLEVRDDGCGITNLEQSARDTGLGLRNMRERVDFLGGFFDVTSSKNKGTRLIVRLPIGAQEMAS